VSPDQQKNRNTLLYFYILYYVIFYIMFC